MGAGVGACPGTHGVQRASFGAGKMYRHIVLSVCLGLGSAAPAAALDAGVGASVGGVGVGAGVGVSRGGLSAGVGANVGRTAAAKADASAGSSGTNVGAGASVGSTGVGAAASVGSSGLGASASLGSSDASAPGGGAPSGGSAGGTAGTGSGTGIGSGSGTASGGAPSSGAPAGSGSSSSRSTGAAPTRVARIDPAAGTHRSVLLPQTLSPTGRANFWQMRTALAAVPGTPPAVVQACRQAVAAAAAPYGMVQVRATSAGTVSRLRKGGVAAPIAVRVQYARLTGVEIRQARITCRLDASGSVVALK